MTTINIDYYTKKIKDILKSDDFKDLYSFRKDLYSFRLIDQHTNISLNKFKKKKFESDQFYPEVWINYDSTIVLQKLILNNKITIGKVS